jgi:diadenosine tetraphosphate (Ap4A) HIT family hydrolase
MATLIHQRVELARAGQNPTVVCKMDSGWVVLSDVQLMRGYCILLADPVVPTLNDLSLAQRAIFLRDMSIVGDALLEVTHAARINYEILGNSDPALHVHIVPRYEAEPDEFRKGPVWFYEMSKAPKFDARNPTHQIMKKEIAEAIQKRLAEAQA